MLALIITFLFGLGIAYFATQNTTPITLYFTQYRLPAVPLYAVIVGSILFGLFISWIISIVNAISSTIEIQGKNSTIKEAHTLIERLEKQVRELEVENARLKGEDTQPIVIEKKYTEVQQKPGFFTSLRHRLAL